MEIFDEEKFYQEEKVSKMLINDKISMKIIYEKIKQKIFKFEQIEIDNIMDGLVNIKNEEKVILEYILEEPIVIKYKSSILEIISTTHINTIIKKYKILKPIINCKSCSNNNKFEINFKKFCEHKNHELLLEESLDLKIISEEDFISFFNKEKDGDKGCLGKEFKNPEEFEPNFQNYFKDYEIYKDLPFKVYNDKTRKQFIYFLIQNILVVNKKIYSYFGQPGMGKSISIIAMIKYILDHNKYGTIYLNMKSLNHLLRKKEYHKFKQIIIDEIPYLFKGNHSVYLKCSTLIHHFSIKDEDSIWDLISELIKFIISISNKKICIFIFDQYNNKIDKNDRIIKIFEEFIANPNQSKTQLAFVSFSSMNNKDIKNYKINIIKKNFDENLITEINFIKSFNELNDILDIDEFKFEDDSYDEYYELIGKNIKNYNILNYYFTNQKDIDNLIQKTRNQIIDNIKLYYNCKNSDKNLIKLLYFSTKKNYDLKSFLDVIDFVPFKYFIIKIKEDLKKQKHIQIDFASPLIEEVVNDLLDKVIYCKLNIYKTLSDDKKIDGVARDHMFEKLITYLLDPNTFNNHIYFKDVNITEKITLRKFIPRMKERPIKEKKKKIKLEKGTYLFTQRIINGKALDILIVFIDKDNNAKVIAIQITIHKPNEDIYSNINLKTICQLLYSNLKKLYDFHLSIENIFFTYIFDQSYKSVDKKKFNEMISKCNSEDVAYILFNPDDNNFYNKNGEIIELLSGGVKCPSTKNIKRPSLDGNDDMDVIKYQDLFPKTKIVFSYYLLTDEEIAQAITILKKDTEIGEKINGLTFVETKIIQIQDDFEKSFVYFGRTNTFFNTFIVYFSLEHKTFILKFLKDEPGNNIKMEEKKTLIKLFDKFKIVA